MLGFLPGVQTPCRAVNCGCATLSQWPGDACDKVHLTAIFGQTSKRTCRLEKHRGQPDWMSSSCCRSRVALKASTGLPCRISSSSTVAAYAQSICTDQTPGDLE